MDVDLILRARWTIPGVPEGVVLEDHALVVHEGRILALLPESEAADRYRPRDTLALERHALIPGLVNAHTHAAMVLLRGFADDLPLMDWLENHVWPTEARWVDEAFVADGTALAVAEMLRGGTTCFNDMYFFPDRTAEVAQAAGMRACVGLIVLDAPTAWAGGVEEYLAKGEGVARRFEGSALVRMAVAPHAPYSVSDAGFEGARALAERLGVPVHVHVHETEDEIRGSLDRHGVRPLERLDRLGLVGPRLVAVHMTQLAPREMDRVAEAGAHVVHCPEANLKLASGFCPVHTLVERGGNVALGTDGAASNNDLDLFGEMRSAALLGKAVAGTPTAIPVGRALHMATLAGARALGLDDEIGSLEVGKAADVVAVDLGGLESRPVHDALSSLVYVGGRERVTDVWIAGQRVLDSRRLTTLDEERLLGTAQAWRARIAGG